MNKNELVEAVAARTGDRRGAAAAVDAVLDVVARTVASGERVALSGFGVFEKVDRAPRTARNPATGGTVDVAATSVPRFRAGQVFKGVVSGQRALPQAPAGPAGSSGTDAPDDRRGRTRRVAVAAAADVAVPSPAGKGKKGGAARKADRKKDGKSGAKAGTGKQAKKKSAKK